MLKCNRQTGVGFNLHRPFIAFIPFVSANTRKILCGVLFSGMVAVAHAQDLVRPGAVIESIPIQGVTLKMTPEVAFTALRSAGFRAGNLETFSDWQTDGIEFVRGVYGSREGHSSVVLERRGAHIVLISETFNRPGVPLDAGAEIGAVQRQLSIPADAPRCRVANPQGGTCQVRDADNPENVNVVYTLQVISTMRLVSVARTRELKNNTW